MLFKLNAKGPWTFVGEKSSGGEGAAFIPGVNKFEDKEWAKAKKHPQVIKWLGDKTLEIITEKDAKQEDAESKNASLELADLTAKEAIQVVKQCWNTKLLESWLETEERATVLSVVNKQLDELKPKG